MPLTTVENIERVIIDALVRIAPDIDPAELEHGLDLRRDLDIDAADFQSFVAELHARFAITIPERDYRRLTTLHGCVDYIRGLATRS